MILYCIWRGTEMYHIIANGSRLNENSKEIGVVKGVFDRAGKEYKFYFTERKGHAKEIAEEITAGEEQLSLIAMGGDGTLHEVLNGMKRFNRCNLGIIPVGTGNDFAEAVNIPCDVKYAAEVISFKAAKPIDYIQLSSGLKSINAVGMGIDVDVLKRAYAGRDHKKSKYFKALIASLLKFKSVNFTVACEGREEKHFGLIAAVGNGKQIGGGIKLFPDAQVDDGYLDLLVVDYLSLFKTVRAFVKLMRGKLGGIKEITQLRCKEVTFIPDSEQYTIQAEGELYDNMPLEAKIVSGQLKFYIP